ncbi:anti-sigma factor [Nocardia sp. NPDC088792]|uniref:anti-sigma factor n=1 Tax=Nocardia sp. NPDC088792 TaxID=3364332 RepID=UPI0037FAC3F0
MGTTVGLRVNAEPEQLTMLRALAETVTLLADFDVEEVNDIRLVLDEVATILIGDAVSGSKLDCEVTYGGAEVAVRVTAVTSSENVLEDVGLSWNIVRALTDSLDATRGVYARPVGGYPTVVEFRWVRGERGRSRI